MKLSVTKNDSRYIYSLKLGIVLIVVPFATEY